MDCSLLIWVIFFFPSLSFAVCPPDSVYGKTYNKCYQFVNESLTFLTAENYCQGLGGHLVAVTSSFEGSFISVEVIGNPDKIDFWIGANYLYSQAWQWTYGIPFAYTNWGKYQPSSQTLTSCAMMENPENMWYTISCSTLLPFVCAIDLNIPSTPAPTCPPPPACPTCPAMTTPTLSTATYPENCPPEQTGNRTCSGTCPTDFTMSPIDCKCYYWPSGNGMAYNESITYCQARGANLAKITTSAQNQWIADWITETASLRGYGIYYYYPWIGLSCYGSMPISCSWADGSSLGCYTNFETLYTDEDLTHFNGKNGQFFMRISTSANDFGQWCRYEPDSFGPVSVLCMRNSL